MTKLWPLMVDCVSRDDREELASFVLSSDRLTMGPMTEKFESSWSDWLGSKYSLFVNSGSSANLLMLSAVRELYLKDCENPKVLTSTCTWATNISHAKHAGYDIVFADISNDDYGIDLESVTEEVDVVLVTHLMGIPSNISKIKERFPDAIILEDCCESHGAKISEKKIGTFGSASTFSFYFGHHMTTIEGGMVSTDDFDLYCLMKAKRSHGMVRDLPNVDEFASKYPDFDKRFLFMTDGYNLRPTDIQAVLGLSQLKRLDEGVESRRRNFVKYQTIMSKYPDQFSVPEHEGNSSFCFPFVCNSETVRNELKQKLEEAEIETRPFLVGNILRQPYMENYGSYKHDNFANAENMHTKAFYIGNHQFLTDEHFNKLSEVLDEYFSM